MSNYNSIQLFDDITRQLGSYHKQSTREGGLQPDHKIVAVQKQLLRMLGSLDHRRLRRLAWLTRPGKHLHHRDF